MQGRRCPTVIGILACLVVIWTGGLSGCATTSESGSVPIPPVGRSEAKVSFEIQSSGRGSATIFINGEERGDTPVYIRADADVTGHTAEDLVIKAVWDGG